MVNDRNHSIDGTSLLLYKNLADRIRDDIFNGRFKAKEQIPTEFDLCETYHVSRSTVRKAIADLVDEGLLTKVHGKGTFVASARVTQPVSEFSSFTGRARNAGIAVTSQVLDIAYELPTNREAAFFNIDAKEKILVVRRLRFANGKPVMIETNRFTSEFDFLREENLEGSLYEVILRRSARKPSSGSKTIEICYATPEEAELLKIPRGSALILFADSVFDQHGRALHLSKQVIRGDEFKYPIG